MKTPQRVKDLGEVFTPPKLVNEMLDKLPKFIWKDETKTFIDSTCGNGNILVEIKKRLIKHHKEDHILENMIFGADIMEDNIIECIERLYGKGKIKKVKILKEFQTDGLIAVFEHNGKLVKNIVQADGLKYDYTFGREKEFEEYTPELNQMFEWN